MSLKEGYKREPAPTRKRYCQFLKLNPDTLEQYKHWHNSQNIWEEIPQGIRGVGILDMEIYIIDNLSFMIVETPLDFQWDEAFDRLAKLERQEEWEDFVGQFQNTASGARSEEKWILMDRAFSLVDALNQK